MKAKLRSSASTALRPNVTWQSNTKAQAVQLVRLENLASRTFASGGYLGLVSTPGKIIVQASAAPSSRRDLSRQPIQARSPLLIDLGMCINTMLSPCDRWQGAKALSGMDDEDIFFNGDSLIQSGEPWEQFTYVCFASHFH